MKFRSDINGLRAIAVLAVVLYHFNVKYFNGGFIGVDVFFVISGFLMTTIIINRINNSSFSIIGFYFDRARRIIPAISALCISLSIVCWFILIPVDYSTLGKHIYSSILFISNIVYFNEINYFDASADKKWLLHTWSLSVEWQFYIIYPLIIIAAFKMHGMKAVKLLLMTGFAASIFFSIYLSYTGSQSNAFYLLHARAWEMIAGGIICFIPTLKNDRLKKKIYLLGIIGILLSIHLFTKYTVWPGYLALLPVIATFAVLYANTNTIILNNGPFQFIGKISYSVYLWHWPVVVLLNYFSLKSPTMVFSGIVASLIIGALSYYLVENPARNAIRKLSEIPVKEFSIIALVTCIPFSLGAAINYSNGVQSRFPFALLTQDQIMKERARYWVDGDKEHPVDKTGDTKFVIIGNSYGIDLTYALMENGFHGDITYLRTTNLCSNFSATPNDINNKDYCSEIMKKVLSNKSLESADYILMSDDWAAIDDAGLYQIIDSVKAKTQAKIYIFGPKMAFTESPSDISFKAMKDRQSTVAMINSYAKNYYGKFRFLQDEHISGVFNSDEMKKRNVRYISSLKVQCGDEMECNILNKDKDYLYFDSGHFTAKGAKDFGEKLKEIAPELFPPM